MAIDVNKIQLTNANLINNSTQKAVFRGTTKPVPCDSVEISSKKKSISNTAKWGIGLAAIATIIGGIFLYKHFSKNTIKEAFTSVEQIDKKFANLEKNLPDVQKKFKDVFLRNDLTEEQTREILRGYKEVEKLGLTASKEEYIKAVFEQAKKNYQIYNPSMTIKIDNNIIFEGACGACAHENGAVFITKRGLQESHSRLFEIIHHELRHAKQNECLYNCIPDGSIKGLIYTDYIHIKYPNAADAMNFYREIAKKAGSSDCSKKEVQREIDKILHVDKIIEERFGKPDINKVPEEYRKIVEQINKEATTTLHYPYRLEEKDAFRIGDIMRKLIFG